MSFEPRAEGTERSHASDGKYDVPPSDFESAEFEYASSMTAEADHHDYQSLHPKVTASNAEGHGTPAQLDMDGSLPDEILCTEAVSKLNANSQEHRDSDLGTGQSNVMEAMIGIGAIFSDTTSHPDVDLLLEYRAQSCVGSRPLALKTSANDSEVLTCSDYQL